MTVAIAFFAVGLLLGGLLAYLWARGRAGEEAAAAEARAAELDRQRQELETKLVALQAELAAKGEQLARTEESKHSLVEARETLEQTFKALSADALRDNSQQFLNHARALLETIAEKSKGDLEQRRSAIESLLKPLGQALNQLQGEIRGLEGQRKEAYTNLEKELHQLQRETSNLTTALRRPQGRGRWGEMTLERVVEAAEMSPYCDFTEQPTREGEEGRLRPDLVIHLPGKREIVVDSKAPLDAYLEAVEAPSEQERAQALRKHAAQVRKHMEQLAEKSYWSQFPASPDFVVMFLPGESFFSAALEQDRTLIDDGLEKHVILATPTTLIALLKAAAYGWRQEQVVDNARKISDLGRTLYERVTKWAEHLQGVGDALGKALSSYDSAVGSLESRVLPAARRLKELGATAAEDIPTLEPIGQVPRPVGQQSLEPAWELDQPETGKK